MATSLRSLPGSALLARLRALVARGNAMEAELIAHLGEVESRGLHVEEAVDGLAYMERTDGTSFDSSIPRGKPIRFPVGKGRVIKGWDEGIMSM